MPAERNKKGGFRLHKKHKKNAQNRNRTSDTRIFSPLLYQLSYLGIVMRTLIKLRE